MKPRLSLLIATVGIAVVMGAFWVLHPQAASDLKEYRNEEFGYSFQYPGTCTFGPMPGECKQNPPEEMPQECLCFLNAENPNSVFLQTFQDDGQNLTLSSITITHTEAAAFNPPPGVELVPWLKDNFSEMYSDIPEKPNGELGGVPSVEMTMPPTLSTYSYQDAFVLREDKLLVVRMLNPTNRGNQALYNQILSSFSWQE
jgi:hypothetical protein